MRGGKRGARTGVQLPSRYDGGNPAVNFWLAILLRAKADFYKCHCAREMVRAFVKHRGTTLQHFMNPKRRGRGVDSLEEAWWVCKYIKGESE